MCDVSVNMSSYSIVTVINVQLYFAECEKPAKKKMAWDSFTSIKDFGYEFNEGNIVINDCHQMSGSATYCLD
jgi:hypothetical protein